MNQHTRIRPLASGRYSPEIMVGKKWFAVMGDGSICCNNSKATMREAEMVILEVKKHSIHQMSDPHANFKRNQKRIKKLLDGMQYQPKNSALTPLLGLVKLIGRGLGWFLRAIK